MDKHDIESFVEDFLSSLGRYQRLLDDHIYPPFADLERAAADQAQPEHDEWVQRRYPDPEDYDAGAAADHFNALSQRIYDDLFAMQTTLVNLFTAGLYHSFEQQMATMYLHAGGTASATPKPTFETWAKASLGLDVTTGNGWPKIIELALVANVVKHAEGRSEHQLRSLRPDVFQHTLMRDPAYATIPASHMPTRAPLSGEDLYLIKADFDQYAAAVSSFWQWFRASSGIVRLADEGPLEIAMPRPKRPVEELRAASEHLHYEVSMFDATGRALGSGLFGAGAATNAFLESFTIHTRALLQFLFPKDPKPDDVLAEDFFENPKIWLDLRGELPEPLGAVNRRVGKEIAHLTYTRLEVTPETKGWNIPVIWAAVLRLVQAFAKNVPHDRLGPSWQTPESTSEA